MSKFHKTQYQKIWFYLFFCVILSPLGHSQTYIYSTISGSGATPGNLITGTGSWASPVIIPAFTFTCTTSNNRISSFDNTLGGAISEVSSISNAWENKYGQINESTNNCIKVGSIIQLWI